MIFPRMVDTFTDLVPSEDQPDGEIVFVRDSFSLWISLDGRWFGVFNSELQGVIDDNQQRLDRLESASAAVGTVESPSSHTIDYVSGNVASITTSSTHPHVRINNDTVNDVLYTASFGDESQSGLINSHETVILELEGKGITTVSITPYNTSVTTDFTLVQIEAI